MDHLKKLIGERVKELRGNISQEAIEAACGVDRGIIGKIERGTTDYRIESLLKVLAVLRDGEAMTVLAADPLEKTLHEQLHNIVRAGIPSEIHFVMDALGRAAAESERARSAPISHRKPQRPA